MNVPKSLIKKGLLFFTFLHLAQFCFSQEADSTKRVINFKGAVSITNNGFSLVPTFSLGKPAVVTIFSISGKGRLSFEPEIRYSMEFKPWSMVFIWRYKLVRKEKFQLALGTHLPALNFITGPVIKNGVQQDAIQARRFFPVMELIPNYVINKNINLGIYYLYSIGLEKELTKDNHFVSLRVGFNDIPFIKRCYLRFNPKFYYLKLDERDGFYVAGSLTLAHRDCPFSLSTLMNKAIDSNILAKDFDWNVSLNYTFGRDYVRK
ncbi:MAG: hypothetical protein IPJ82_21340 [Lewinellaceae bacterium]|nr:hypothetical protein [Lewinellaceae bacterium]